MTQRKLLEIRMRTLKEMTPLEYAVWRLYSDAQEEEAAAAAAELARLQEIEKAAEVTALKPAFASYKDEALYYRDVIAKIEAAVKAGEK
jgi:hypothetical protein